MDGTTNYNGSAYNGTTTSATNYCASTTTAYNGSAASATNNGSAASASNYCAAATATNYGRSIKPIKLRIPWCFC